MLNPLYILSGMLYHQPVSNIIDCADMMTKERFIEWCKTCETKNATTDEIAVQAAEAFDWWNMLKS